MPLRTSPNLITPQEKRLGTLTSLHTPSRSGTVKANSTPKEHLLTGDHSLEKKSSSNSKQLDFTKKSKNPSMTSFTLASVLNAKQIKET